MCTCPQGMFAAYIELLTSKEECGHFCFKLAIVQRLACGWISERQQVPTQRSRQRLAGPELFQHLHMLLMQLLELCPLSPYCLQHCETWKYYSNTGTVHTNVLQNLPVCRTSLPLADLRERGGRPVHPAAQGN